MMIPRSTLAALTSAWLAWLPGTSMADAQPWLDTLPTPVRTFYVAPAGNGSGGSIAAPMSLAAALAQAAAGDLYWLLDGDYAGGTDWSADGRADAPIVFRAHPGAHVRILGGIDLTGSDTWLWGVELTDPGGINGDGCVQLLAPGLHLVNNVIHHCDNAVSAWDFPRQVLYGNIIHDGHHNVYAQNSFARGYKYFVNNISVDAVQWDGNGPYEFHAYGEGGQIGGMWLEQNIFYNTQGGGEVLVGARNQSPNSNEVLRGNHFHDTLVRMGYARPIQFEFTDNYLVRSILIAAYSWGEGEARYPLQPPGSVTGNSLLLPSDGLHLRFRTSAYVNVMIPGCDALPCRAEGLPAIRADDRWNHNTYSAPFHAGFHANGVDRYGMNNDFATWQSLTAAAGSAFDTDSQVIPAPGGQRVVLIPNAYEPGRAHLAVYNFAGGNATIAVDLSGVVANGRSYHITAAKEAFGAPVASGVQIGTPVSLPVTGPFAAFLVTASGNASDLVFKDGFD